MSMNNIERLKEKKITITNDCYLRNLLNRDIKDNINTIVLKT